MSNISFFTPIDFGDQPTSFFEKLTEAVDGYFYLGGRVARPVRGSYLTSGREVFCVEGRTTWWKTALKVLSYFTVVIPLFMMAAKVILRTCNKYVLNPEHMMVKAPLTLVRTPNATDLRISVLYNQMFKPCDPIVPKPTEIGIDGKHSWNVQTHGNGTMSVNNQRINMIWWEAMRNSLSGGVDPSQAVCVKRTELEGFLDGVLEKAGVRDVEREAFTHYWKEILRAEQENTPYVLVQMISPSELRKYIPEMQVEGERAASFALKRFYFRFEPVYDDARGIRPESYLDQLAAEEFGPHAVIDLGGEVIGDVTRDWEPSFNEGFIQKYIYAG